MSSYYNSICILSWLALLILSVLIYENARIPAREKKIFYITYALIAVSQFAEWAGVLLSGRGDSMMLALRIAKCADYIFTPAVGGALIAQMPFRNIWTRIVTVILVFNTVFQLVSAFTGWVFFITDENSYTVGPLYWIYLSSCLMIVVVVTIQFIIFGKNYRRHNQVSLYMILLLTVAAITMQELLPWTNRTYYIGITLTSALLFIHVTEFSQLEADDNLNRQLIKINTDALTGLFSRHAYSQALKDYNAMEELPKDFAAFSIDVNGLKNINDTLGHEAGDELIIGAARCIEHVLGKLGSCYRTGGDEFIALVNADKAAVGKAIRDLRLETGNWAGLRVKEIHLAVGCAMAQDHPDLIAEKLVNEADKAMYAEKAAYYLESGRDRRRYHS